MNACIRRTVRVTSAAVDSPAEEALSPLCRRHPRPIHPRRIVAHVPLVATFQVGYPVSVLVLVISCNLSIHVGGPLLVQESVETNPI